MRKSLWFGLLLLSSVACTTAPSHPPRVATAPDVQRELAELREAMTTDIGGASNPGDKPSSPGRSYRTPVSSVEIPAHPSVDGAIRYFSTGRRNTIQTSLRRSARYRQNIDRILDEHGVPRAFAYLPVIESAYLPHLTSSAGARGMWQFMPATAREYGLRVDWWVDERIDIEKSTYAAARYLRDLHRMFSDWPLALAAYNAGPGRVRRTLAEHKATTFWQLLEKSALPKETRGYVPTFFATLAIAGDPDRFGFELPEPVDDSDDEWQSIEIRGPLSLEYLSRVCGTPADALQAENGTYHRGVVPPGRHPVRVPRSGLAAIQDRVESLHEEDSVIQIASYTLRPGESLKELSKSLGVELDDVFAMNGVRKDRFRAGDSIYLPLPRASVSSRLTEQRASSTGSTYVVSRGDTLYSIARRHGLTVDQLRLINDLDGDAVIQPGQQIRVADAAGASAGGR